VGRREVVLRDGAEVEDVERLLGAGDQFREGGDLIGAGAHGLALVPAAGRDAEPAEERTCSEELEEGSTVRVHRTG
jgi:hypothetical protein